MHARPATVSAPLAALGSALAGRALAGVALAALAGVLLTALGGARPAGAEPPAPPPLPTPAERVDWWLERLVSGSEETTWLAPNFNHLLLADATQNLAALGEAATERLRDAAFQRRIQTNPEANAWHAVLGVLGLMAAPDADVVRAWAVPALDHPLYTLRRLAIPLLAQQGDLRDLPLLLGALQREAHDGYLAGALSKALLRAGAPWDGAGARAILDGGIADQAGHSSGLWAQVPLFAALAPEGARADLLAWWALLSEASGPRARPPARTGEAGGVPGAGAVAVVGPEHASTSGALPAARTRLALEARGFAAAVRSVEADLSAADPAVAAVARERLARGGDPRERERARANAERLVRTLETVNVRPRAMLAALAGDAAAAVARGGSTEVRDGEIPSVATVSALLATLGDDPDPAAADLLRRFLLVPVQSRTWAGALRAAYRGLERLGAGPEATVEALLGAADPELVARGLALVREAKSPSYVATLEAWLERPAAASWRAEGRRVLVLLYVTARGGGGISEERLAAWAKNVGTWTEDPSDPSAPALAASLLDLGPAGEARFTEGLRGPRRPAWLGALSFRPRRYLSPALVEALLAPIGRDTPAAERRAALTAALAVASSSAAPHLDALHARLAPEDRADVEWIRRIVRRRAETL